MHFELPQQCGKSGVDNPVAGDDLLNCSDQLPAGDALEEISLGTLTERFTGQSYFLICREHDDFRRRCEFRDIADEVGPALLSELEVQEHQVRVGFLKNAKGCLGAVGLTDDLAAWRLPEHRDDASPDERMIVDDHDPDGFR
jgi:hypothetical protein